MQNRAVTIGIGVSDVIAQSPVIKKTLSQWLAQELGAEEVDILAMRPLSGGAIQENWQLSIQITGSPFAGPQEWVLRTDAKSSVSVSHSRHTEFELLSYVFSHGIRVPEPICLCLDTRVIGRIFFIMKTVTGQGQGHKLTRLNQLKTGSDSLGAQLGQEMARLHNLPAGPELTQWLGKAEQSAHTKQIHLMRYYLDALATAHPVLEFALNWLEDRQQIWAPSGPAVLCHRDFRTGNFLVEQGEMTALLDWEFADLSDRHEDIGWLCARCWRFSNPHLTVGGLSSFASFREAYEREAGQKIDLAAMGCWQVMAEIRWAVIALQQAARNDSGAELALQLALSGQMVPEMEYHMLQLIDEIDHNRWQDDKH